MMDPPIVSYSSLSRWESCARNWKAVYIEKSKKSDETKASAKGVVAHTAIEHAAKTGTAAADPWVQGILQTYRNAGGTLKPEMWLTATRDHKYAPYGVTPWIRNKADLVWRSADGAKGAVLDWKTGAWSPRSASDVDWTQLRMNAMCAFIVFPEMEKLTAVMAYTSKQKVYPITIHRREALGDAQSADYMSLRRRIAEFETKAVNGPYLATPGFRCKTCPVTQCPHNPEFE
jgi:hypothetical protein